MPHDIYYIVTLVVTVLGMLGAFHLGRLNREEPVFRRKPTLSLIDTEEEEKVNLPSGVGYGGFDAEEEGLEAEEER